MQAHAVSPATPTRVLAALAGATLLASLGISIVTVALPTLAREFSTGVQHVQWVVLAYLLAVTTAIVVAGRLGDRYGHRRVLVAGIVLFTLASACCTVAPSLNWLIAGRVVQGLGAAALMSLPLSIAKGLVAPAHLGMAMGLLGTLSAIGTALGPALGGLLLGTLSWRAAFVLLAVCGAGVLVLVLKGIAQTQASGTVATRMDWAGGFWLSVTLACVALAATGSTGGVAIPTWMLLSLAVFALLIFVRTEQAASHPLVPVSLLRERAIATALTTNLLVGAIMMSTLVVGPFFLALGMGLTPTETGLVMAVGPLAAALSGVPAGWITDRAGPHRTLLGGLLLATAGLCGFAVLPAVIHTPGYVISLLLITPGFQLFLAANNTAVMADAAATHRGLLSGLLGLSRNVGFMMGASLLPLLFSSLLGAHELTHHDAQAIRTAFSTTFLSAAGLCGLAIVLALLAHRAPRDAGDPARNPRA